MRKLYFIHKDLLHNVYGSGVPHKWDEARTLKFGSFTNIFGLAL